MRELRLWLALRECVGGVCAGGRGMCRGDACWWRDCNAMLLEWSPSTKAKCFEWEGQRVVPLISILSHTVVIMHGR